VRWGLGAAVGLLVAASVLAVALVIAPSGKGDSSIVAAWYGGTPDCGLTSLVRLDPATLRLRGRDRLNLRGFYKQPVLSPDRTRAVLGGASGTLLFANVARLTRLASLRVGSPYEDTQVVGWPAAKRVVALDVSSDAHRVGLTKIVVVDSEHAQVVREARFPWWAATGNGTTQAGRIAVLVVSWTRLAPPRLVVVGLDGRIHEVRLDRLRAGVGYSRGGEDVRFPGLAVDRRGERAFVVNEGEPVAVVDLRTLRVRYRHVAGLASPGRAAAGPAKPTGTSNPRRGPSRVAAWLGDGLIAVSGTNSYTGPTNRWLGEARAPAGLQVIDTRSWRVRTFDRRPADFQWLSGRLVASTRAWDPAARRVRGDSLIAFDRTGQRVYRIRGNPRTYWQAFHERIYIDDGPSRLDAVLDARDGRELGRVPGDRLISVTPGYC
jgi:hypothetical protein